MGSGFSEAVAWEHVARSNPMAAKINGIETSGFQSYDAQKRSSAEYGPFVGTISISVKPDDGGGEGKHYSARSEVQVCGVDGVVEEVSWA